MEYEKDLMPRILRDINDGVIALDKQGRIIYINPQCRKLLNLSKDDIGKTYFEVFFCITACVCLYLLLLSTLEFFKVNVSTKILTQVINAMVFVIGVIIYKKTDFTSEDLGLKIHNYKETFICAGVISVSIVLVLVLFKLIILRIYPDFFLKEFHFGIGT